MKQYFTGFFTGACLVASAVMFMGASESNSKIGKYQGFGDNQDRYLIDTETGHMWGWSSHHKNNDRGFSSKPSGYEKSHLSGWFSMGWPNFVKHSME